jgi:hypothetical protein
MLSYVLFLRGPEITHEWMLSPAPPEIMNEKILRMCICNNGEVIKSIP